MVAVSIRDVLGGPERRVTLRLPALVIAQPCILGLFREGCPALGGDPRQGGWCRIDPPLAVSVRVVA